ncbi:hypothetical protein PflQ2_4384 [Pseudomonas fluorescens Q2-87]|uniref:Uncharacterized protein n=1 Tax=Pseudomonas fluorescens (strain Q2-87) TaxID=1038922 RepID=J2EJP8_PSEFQ|nr:hypothetical protein PflQ2_4384 [Pseudomonas fluorescens Q2-87]
MAETRRLDWISGPARFDFFDHHNRLRAVFYFLEKTMAAMAIEYQSMTQFAVRAAWAIRSVILTFYSDCRRSGLGALRADPRIRTISSPMISLEGWSLRFH